MRRIAIVIGSGQTGHPKLPGARLDPGLYSRFFQTPHGGAWLPGEINMLHDPQEHDLDAALAQTATADFSIVTFSGHGSFDAATQRTSINVNDDFEVPVARLRTHARKQICIIDACRTIVPLRRTAFVDVGGVPSAPPDASYRASCRAFYDRGFREAPDGWLVLFSCSIGQTAGDTREGGVFSRALIDGCAHWAEKAAVPRKTASIAVDTKTALAWATGMVASENPSQQPGHWSSPEGLRLPLAVR